MGTIDLETARQRELRRRLWLLGDALSEGCEYLTLRARAKATGVPLQTLWIWCEAYQAHGTDGLYPHDWDELDEESKRLAVERLDLLGDLAETENVTDDQIAVRAEMVGISPRRMERYLARYRISGLWGLAPGKDPENIRRKKKLTQPPREVATLDELALQEMFRRRKILGDLADMAKVSEAAIQPVADAHGVSVRTLRNWLKAYRHYGLAGLAPQQRSDSNQTHDVSERMIGIIKGLRLSKLDATVRAVHKEACTRARQLGEREPSEWQVRAICDSIREPVKLLADGREDEFRNRFRTTMRRRWGGSQLIYQIDHTQTDVLVKDMRRDRYRTQSGQVRLYLTLVMDSSSRVIVAAIFGYDRPDRHTVAAAIRDALLAPLTKPYGGVPHEIWVDHGKELIAQHVYELTRELGIELQPCRPHQPQEKGIVERFFGTLNTRLWSTLDGYVASSVDARNPLATAELTPAELVAIFWRFVDQYHHEVHSETGETPLDYWQNHCFADRVDPHALDMLLKESKSHKVIKIGIKHEGREYWHPELAAIVGEDVLIRGMPTYMAPDEIEVFYQGRWLCTALATDTERGQKLVRDAIGDAQRSQRQQLRSEIQEARTALQAADEDIAARQQATQNEPPTGASSTTAGAGQETEGHSAFPGPSDPDGDDDESDFLDVLLQRK